MGNWRVDLETWLAPFVTALGHKARARMGVVAKLLQRRIHIANPSG